MMNSNVQEVLLSELAAIDKAYGKENVDLYKSVLKVSPQATPPEMQRAFFHRRQELFGVLGDDSSPLKAQAEKQMDALVLCYRILGDAVMRIEYDVLRAERKALKKKKKRGKEPTRTKELMRHEQPPRIVRHEQPPRTVTPEKEPHSRTVKSRFVLKGEAETEEEELSIVHEKRSFFRRKKPKRKHERVQSVTSFDSSVVSGSSREVETIFSTDVDTYATDTYATETVFSTETDVTLSKRGHEGFLRRATEEIEGCIEDTLSAFDQVFHVFTLEEKDIRAVTGRIQKAKRELDIKS